MLSYKKDFFSHLAQTSPTPVSLEISKAKGVFLKDIRGTIYMDLISGIAVSNLGHGHPAVVKAIKEQADKYTHLMVYGEYILSPQVKFAKKLCNYLPDTLNSVYFVNSGSEAVEGALKLAKRYTGRTEIISFTNAYHGSTHGALSVMGNETLKQSFRPLLPDVRILQYGNKKELNCITEKTACVIIEPVQGEAGTIVPDKSYVQAIQKRCRKTRALLIFDEIQTGLGRTGSLFAFNHFGIVPDILLLGKALGGGLPLGAFISARKIMSSLSNNPALAHITTFGGHPMSCVAGYAALHFLTQHKITETVLQKEKLFRALLRHKAIKEIRGKGLMLALQLGSEELCKKTIEICLKNGIIADWFLFCPSAMRICPPLIINKKEIKQACAKILLSLNQAIS